MNCDDFSLFFRVWVQFFWFYCPNELRLYLEEDTSNPRSKLGASIRMCGTVSELSFLAQRIIFLFEF